MKLLIVYALAGVLISCSPVSSSEPPNEFYIDGKMHRYTNFELRAFQKMWVPYSKKVKGKTVLDLDNQRWVMNFISIDESLDTKCKAVELKSIEVLEGYGIGQTREGTPESGRFDELWTLKICDISIEYRVFHEAETNSLAIYRIPKSKDS